MNTTESTVASANEIIPKLFMEIELKTVTPPKLFRSGFSTLDTELHGFMAGELTMLSGIRGSGKSTFLYSMIANQRDYSRPIVLFTAQQSVTDAFHAILCMKAGVNRNRIRAGMVESEDLAALSVGGSHLVNASIYIISSAELSIELIEDHCQMICSKHGEIGVIMVDYLQKIDRDSNGEIGASLKEIAREFHTPVIITSRWEQRKHPTRSSFDRPIELGEMELSLDTVLYLDQPEKDSFDPSEKKITTLLDLHILKNSFGAVTTVPVIWNSKQGRFQSVEPETESAKWPEVDEYVEVVYR